MTCNHPEDPTATSSKNDAAEYIGVDLKKHTEEEFQDCIEQRTGINTWTLVDLIEIDRERRNSSNSRGTAESCSIPLTQRVCLLFANKKSIQNIKSFDLQEQKHFVWIDILNYKSFTLFKTFGQLFTKYTRPFKSCSFNSVIIGLPVQSH